MTTKKEWLKIMEQPLFNCCGDCPLVKRIEDMIKNSPASSEVIDPFDRPRIKDKEKPKTCEWTWGDDGQPKGSQCGVMLTSANIVLGEPCPFCGGEITKVE